MVCPLLTWTSDVSREFAALLLRHRRSLPCLRYSPLVGPIEGTVRTRAAVAGLVIGARLFFFTPARFAALDSGVADGPLQPLDVVARFAFVGRVWPCVGTGTSASPDACIPAGCWTHGPTTVALTAKPVGKLAGERLHGPLELARP